MNFGALRRWLLPVALLGLALAGTGCARLAAQRLATAPNRYPRWLAPPGRTFLNYPDAFVTNFPLQTVEVGPPLARLAYRVVPPADYGISVSVSNWYARGHLRRSFSFTAQLPAAANAFSTRPRGTVFVLHGYGGDLTGVMPLALRLAQEGWRCVVPDLRGHGQSSGRQISFGVGDAGDLSAVLNRLESAGPTGPVAVVGHSFGAVVALRWIGQDPRVTAAVAIAPYARLETAGLNLRQEYSPWFPEGLSQAGLAALPAYLGLGPGDLDPATWVQRKPAKALFIVGMEDNITTPLDSSRLKALAAPGSRVLFVPGANHETVPYFFNPVLDATTAWLTAETDRSTP
jgi:pimeloyl-ACP methyl ester carboxylesterase